MLIAFVGQPDAQVPQPIHETSETLATFLPLLSTDLIASYLQRGIQTWQPLQSSSSTTAIADSVLILPLESNDATLEAAALLGLLRLECLLDLELHLQGIYLALEHRLV